MYQRFSVYKNSNTIIVCGLAAQDEDEGAGVIEGEEQTAAGRHGWAESKSNYYSKLLSVLQNFY